MKTKTFAKLESKMFDVIKQELKNLIMENGKKRGIYYVLPLGNGFEFGGSNFNSKIYHWNSIRVVSNDNVTVVSIEKRQPKGVHQGRVSYAEPIDCYPIGKMEELYNKIMECVE